MRVPTLIAAVLVPMVALAATADDKKATADLKAMVGKWKVEKSELGGKDITDVLQVLEFEIHAGGKYTAQHGNNKDEGTFTVDPSKSPRQMVVKPMGGPNKGKTVKAIYKIDGDTLTICYDFSADKSDYPQKFESKPDTVLLLTTYKREKK
jgi:uncharacterized protein (TIGR03067 family)